MWKQVRDTEYEVSDRNQIRRKYRDPRSIREHGPYRYLTGSINNWGYVTVCIAGKTYKLHRLVLEAFVGLRPEGYECDHKNRNKLDNRLCNLHWVTRSENSLNRTMTVKWMTSLARRSANGRFMALPKNLDMVRA